jgi:hypothetical protein
MDSESQVFNFNDASFDNSDFDSEELQCTPTNLTIHNFLDVPKIMDYENNIYSIAPSQHFHLICLFKDKYSKELNFFQHCFMTNLDIFQKVFYINKSLNGNFFINPRIFHQYF